MRTVRLSITFNDQLNELLAQGEDRFGRAVVEEKKSLVYKVIGQHLTLFPASRIRDPDLGLYLYPVSKTPFILIYDFDEHEVRIHFVLHKGADRTSLHPSKAQW